MQAQPLWDRVDVNLPYSVTIGDQTLQPGNYVIQQLDDPSGGSQVLLIYSDNGMKFKTSALTIPALQNRTQPNTRVILHHIGNDYYFDKVWIQGKDYGYEFPLPNSVKMRQREAMQPVSVAANASSVPAAQAQATAAQATQSAATNATTMQATTGKATTAAGNQGTMQQATTQQATTQQATTGRATTQQATTQRATTQQATNRQSTMPPASTASSANRGDNSDNGGNSSPSMPHTSAGWLMMLVSGGALSGLGAKLRGKK
jgi:cobalamin biosynthesis Mg chelatase CobN